LPFVGDLEIAAPSACRGDRRLPGGCAFDVLGMRMISGADRDGCCEDEDTAMRTGRFDELRASSRSLIRPLTWTDESGGAGVAERAGRGGRGEDAILVRARVRVPLAGEVSYLALSLRAAKRNHLSLFARVRRVAAHDRPRLVVFACTAVMHALGHAALALAAGMCAWSLVHGTEVTRVGDLPRGRRSG
jgi:hypothetical protein